MRTLPLRAALIRGVLLVAANWPIVLIDFGIESLYKLALSLPVFGGALMAGALAHGDLRNVVADGVGPTANLVLGALAESPVALGAFLGALAIAAIGGEVLMFVVRPARSRSSSPPIERPAKCKTSRSARRPCRTRRASDSTSSSNPAGTSPRAP
jgi:hypothetical protein